MMNPGQPSYPPGNAGGGYPQPGPEYPHPGPGYPPAGGAPPATGGYPAGAAPPHGAGAESLEPSAPPLEKMDTIAGYDPGLLAGGDLPPPSYDEATQGSGPPDRSINTNLPTVNEEQAKEALREHVAQNCCFGSRPAQEVHIRGLGESMAFHYALTSFTETRSTAWAHEPFNGQPIDGPHNGPAPGPWDVPVVPKQKYKDASLTVEVPHTASVKPCHKCIGMCRVKCNSCNGMGRNNCTFCNGTGNTSNGRCNLCQGLGRKQCTWCNGSGQAKCRTCNAKGQLKCYIKLTVQWKTHKDDHVLERTSVPSKLITKATGMAAFDEEQPLVWPVTHFPQAAVNQASRQLVDKHRTNWPRERIILQHHTIRVVPVIQVSYSWKDHEGTYYIYGNERKVYSPDYPQRCCCGCNIL